MNSHREPISKLLTGGTRVRSRFHRSHAGAAPLATNVSMPPTVLEPAFLTGVCVQLAPLKRRPLPLQVCMLRVDRPASLVRVHRAFISVLREVCSSWCVRGFEETVGHHLCGIVQLSSMTYDGKSSRFSFSQQRWDNSDDISALLVKAYIFSLLLLAFVLVWTVGDAWVQYARSARDSAYHFNNFSLPDFPSTV